MKVTGNVKIIQPRVQHPHFWATAKDADTIALRDLGNVMFGWQTRPDDETIEQTVRRWCYERNFTGYDQEDVGQELYSHLAWSVVQWLRSYQHLNEGRGPTIGCTTLAVAYVGLLAGQGIPARIVHGAHGEGSLSAYTSVDNAVEVWSTKWGKWMLVVPHCCFHLERDNGEPVSFHELVTEERTGTPKLRIVPLVGNGTAKHVDFNPHGWRDYVDVEKVGSGNRTVIPVPSEREMWFWLQPVPPLSGDSIGPEETMDCEPQDVLVTPNALQLDVAPRGHSRKRATVSAEHTMIDDAEFQIKKPGEKPWLRCASPIEISLHHGDEFQFRMFAPELGSTSNLVTVNLRGR